MLSMCMNCTKWIMLAPIVSTGNVACQKSRQSAAIAYMREYHMPDQSLKTKTNTRILGR